MDKQTKEAREMAKQLPFKEKISHFWEYHKLHVFFAVVALILVGTTVIQVSNREKYDLEIAYYGGMYFTEEQAVKLEEYIEQYIDDIDGNGEINVNVNVVTAEAPGMTGAQLTEYQAAVGQKFSAEIAARMYDAYIFDEAYFEYAGPDSDYGIIESSFDMSQIQEMQELLRVGDVPLYWCTCSLRPSEVRADEAKLKYDNALKAQKAVQGE